MANGVRLGRLVRRIFHREVDMRLHGLVVAGFFSSLLAATSARADTVAHFPQPGGVGPGLGSFLDGVGIGAGNTGSETTAESFVVPGASGTSSTLTFSFLGDLGGFNFQFGYFDLGAVTADPVSDRQNFALQALSASTLVFDDASQNPVATSAHSVAAGTQLGFFIVPNGTITDFLANSAAFYDPANQGTYGTRQSPLFSISNANPGQFDQFVSFVGNGKTLFAFEDLSRNVPFYSDNSFTDLVFGIDVQLTPVEQHVVPLPAAAWGGMVLLGGLGMSKRLRRKDTADDLA